MKFWVYDNEGSAGDVKGKIWKAKPVAMVHRLFRNFMGSVDQSDVKSHVMKLTSERVQSWHKKQLAFLIEAAIS